MTTDLLELSESIITGRTSIETRHPVAMMGVTELHELADGLAFIESFANVTAFDVDDRLVLIDAGGILAAGKVHAAIRNWSDSPLDTAVYTHGHVDHVFAVPIFEAEDAPIRPTVVAHVNVPRRFDRYQLTNGYNGWINQRQFQLPEPMFPRDFRYPDRTYEHDLDLEVGGLRIELHHSLGQALIDEAAARAARGVAEALAGLLDGQTQARLAQPGAQTPQVAEELTVASPAVQEVERPLGRPRSPRLRRRRNGDGRRRSLGYARDGQGGEGRRLQ